MITTIEETWSGLKQFGLSFRYFRLLETVNPVTVKLGGRTLNGDEVLQDVEAGAWHEARAGEGDFAFLQITTQGSEAVKFVISDGRSGYDRLFTAFSQARTLTLPGNATVGTTEGAVLAAATRSKVVFTADAGNLGEIALGPSGVTLTNSPIVLTPGDSWVDDLAASAAWYAIASTSGQTLRILTAA